MYLNKAIAVLIIALGLAAFTGFARADDIRERMRNRLPIIQELKSRAIVGEDNKGFLAFPSGIKEKQDVVDAENSDRRIVYETIAAQTGATPKIVGQRRAIQIFENAGPGEWLQDKTGKWFQK